MTMHDKIAVEEHFAIPDTQVGSDRYPPKGYWAEVQAKLVELADARLELMDAAGIEKQVLSLNASGIQAIPDRATAIATARAANDRLAEEVARRPDRFAGLAALPMQDPEAAARELRRCVRELGFKGALVNGFSQIDDPASAVYYDVPQYWPFWAEVEKLGVPFYLHPREQLPGRRQPYEGHHYLIGSPWGFAEETSLHALRLMDSGLFDQHPGLTIVLGHFGERIPYDLWRIDHRLTNVPNRPARKKMTDYFQTNFYITTSGHFSTPTLMCALQVVGADRILFAIDYPFEDNAMGATWFDAVAISESDRRKIGRSNAIKLFGLG